MDDRPDLGVMRVRIPPSCCAQHMMNVQQVSPFTCECGRTWMVLERSWQEVGASGERDPGSLEPNDGGGAALLPSGSRSPGAQLEVVLHAVFDEETLDAHVRRLYDPPDDPAPGEPQPGREYLDEVVEEARENVRDFSLPDLSWLHPNKRGVKSLTIQRGSPIVLCSEQEASLVRTLLRRHARMSEMTGHSSGTVALRLLERMGGDVG